MRRYCSQIVNIDKSTIWCEQVQYTRNLYDCQENLRKKFDLFYIFFYFFVKMAIELQNIAVLFVNDRKKTEEEFLFGFFTIIART